MTRTNRAAPVWASLRARCPFVTHEALTFNNAHTQKIDGDRSRRAKLVAGHSGF